MSSTRVSSHTLPLPQHSCSVLRRPEELGVQPRTVGTAARGVQPRHGPEAGPVCPGHSLQAQRGRHLLADTASHQLAAWQQRFASCSCTGHNLSNCTLAAPGARPRWATATLGPATPHSNGGSHPFFEGAGSPLCCHAVLPAAFLSEAGRDKALPTALWEISTAEIRRRQVQEAQGPQGTRQWGLGCLRSTVKV